MKLLSTLLENEGINEFLTENQGEIFAASEALGTLPQTIKNYIAENMEDFIGEDVKETYANMVVFTESAVSQYMHELCNQIVK